MCPSFHRDRTPDVLDAPNFLGPIGPSQPAAKPWDLSRYDVLLNIADKQRAKSLSQEKHAEVCEQVVLAGRFHRAHAAFENALQDGWVDSLHKVLGHAIARKILLWRLQRSHLNVTPVVQPPIDQYEKLKDVKEEDVEWSLFFDLSKPLRNSSDAACGASQWIIGCWSRTRRSILAGFFLEMDLCD